MAESQSVTWLFRLADGVSGPSGNLVKSLENISKKYKALEEKSPSKGLMRSFRLLNLGVEEFAGPLKKATGFLIGFGVAAAASAIAIVAAGTRYALNATTFRKDTIRGLSAITGIGKEAERVFHSASRMSQRTIFDDTEFLGMLRTLRGAGLSEGRSNDILAAISDVASFNPSKKSEVGKGLADLFEKMKMSNSFDMGTVESVASLSGGVISQADLIGRVAKLKNWSIKSDAEFQAAKNAISQGIIKNTEGTNILLDMVKDKLNAGKGLGFASASYTDESIDGMVSRIKKQVANIFASIDTKPFTDALRTISGLLDENSASGQSFKTMISGALQDVSSAMKAIDLRSVTSAMSAMKAIFEGLWEAGKGFFEGFGGTLKSLMSPLLDLIRLSDRTGGSVSFIGASMKALGQATAAILAVLGYAVIGIAAVVYGFIAIGEGVWWLLTKIWKGLTTFNNWVLGIPKYIADNFDGFAEKMKNMGKAMMDGLIDGLSASWESLKQKVKDIANSVVTGVKDVLGIKSPSRVMLQLGRYTIEGFTEGVNDNALEAETAIKQAVSVSHDIAPLEVSRGTSARSGAPISITVNLTVNGSDRETAQKTALEFEIALRDTLKKVLVTAA